MKTLILSAVLLLTSAAASADEGLVVSPRAAVSLNAVKPDNTATTVVSSMEVGATLRSGVIGADARFSTTGLGLEALVYPVVSDSWRMSIGLGWLWTGGVFALPTVQDVPRRWDATISASVELPIKDGPWVMLGLRSDVPNPVYLLQHDHPVYADGQQVYGEAGRYLNLKNVARNVLVETQFVVGLVF